MRTIAIGLLALTFASGVAGAQTAGEQARILRDFEQRVNDYARHLVRRLSHGLKRRAAGVTGATRVSVVDNDLVIRDANADVIIAVLRGALGTSTTR